MPHRLPAIRALMQLVILLAVAVSSPAVQAQQIETSVQYAILMDAETGAVLYQKNADALMSPASMSKLMTLAVAFDALKAGTLSFEQEITVSKHAVETGGSASGASAMGLSANERVKVSELILGIVVQSGNDACIALAEGLAPSEDEFARLMTKRARELGMSRSTFGNSTGLPDPDQLMTVRDIAILSRYLIHEFPEYYKYFALRNYQYKTYKFGNRVPLIGMNIGVDGLKTGYSEESGYGMAISAVQGGRRLIVVINGAKGGEERNGEVRKLLDWGFKSFKEAEIFEPGAVVGQARVWGGTSYYVPVKGDGPIRILVPRDSVQEKLKASLVYMGPLKPPIKRGDRVALLRVETSAGSISEVPLYAAESVEAASMMARGFDTVLYMLTKWLPPVIGG